jgi:uncharacterized protein (TIGR03435 family)
MTPARDPGFSTRRRADMQLGLKLEPAKAPTDVLVIDQGERPTPN